MRGSKIEKAPPIQTLYICAMLERDPGVLSRDARIVRQVRNIWSRVRGLFRTVFHQTSPLTFRKNFLTFLRSN